MESNNKKASLCNFDRFFSSIIEYETPKVVKVHNPGIGLLRRALQLAIIMYVGLYQLYIARGYQEFAGIESSVTTKVKGYSISQIGNLSLHPETMKRYERVWDEADYVIPPAENGAFFVTTNVVITPNQTWGKCPEDPREVPVVCVVDDPKTNTSLSCTKDRNLRKSHGPQTGLCVPSDRMKNMTVCQISSWCPVEDDRLLLGKERPLITGSEAHTAFIKNSIRFSHFGDTFHRNNMPYGVCVYNFSDPSTHLCPIFRLGDIVGSAGGNYSKMAVKGGVVAIHISWLCNLDFDFNENCLPKYNFRLLDTYGWNFRHAHFHEENRRTLYKVYGIKFVIIVQGRAGKFDLKNTVINIVAGLGLLSFITMFCDFILLHYMEERKIVKEKKFEILDRNQVLAGLLNIISATHVGTQAKESAESLLKRTCNKSSQWELVKESGVYDSQFTEANYSQSAEKLLDRDEEFSYMNLAQPEDLNSTKDGSCVLRRSLEQVPRGDANGHPGHDSCDPFVSSVDWDGSRVRSVDWDGSRVRSVDWDGSTVTGLTEHSLGFLPPQSHGYTSSMDLRDVHNCIQMKDDLPSSLRSSPENKTCSHRSSSRRLTLDPAGVEYIDCDSTNGWTHHKVTNGQLSLHIVSQV